MRKGAFDLQVSRINFADPYLEGVRRGECGFHAAMQAPGAVTGIRIAYTMLPIAGTVLAVAAMWNYDLSEEKANDMRRKIDARKAAVS